MWIIHLFPPLLSSELYNHLPHTFTRCASKPNGYARYISPTGERCRSRFEVARLIGLEDGPPLRNQPNKSPNKSPNSPKDSPEAGPTAESKPPKNEPKVTDGADGASKKRRMSADFGPKIADVSSKPPLRNRDASQITHMGFVECPRLLPPSLCDELARTPMKVRMIILALVVVILHAAHDVVSFICGTQRSVCTRC